MATSISRSMGKGLTPVDPLPPIPELADLYAKFGADVFCQGKLVMIAGRAGSLKSGLAMFMAARWNVPTIYVNGDQSAWTANSRMLGILSDRTSEEVKEVLWEGGARRAEFDDLARGSRVWFMHDSRPELDDIEAEIDAFVEAYDAYPSCLFIDNLVDVAPLSGDDLESLNELLQQFKDLARVTGACIVVLHHNKADGDSSFPAPLEGLKYRLDTSPEVVLSVAVESRADKDELPFRMSVVKNREGKASRKAEEWVEIVAIPEKTTFKARTYEQVVVAAPPAAVPVYGGQAWGN